MWPPTTASAGTTHVLKSFIRYHRRRHCFIPSAAWFQTAGTAALLFVGADVMAQYLETTAEKDDTHTSQQHQLQPPQQTPTVTTTVRNRSASFSWYDPWRGTGAAVLGVVLGGGVYPAAYAQLDRLLPGNSWRTLLLKSAIEIVTVGISVNTASLLGRASWQGTHTWSDVSAHVTTEIPRVTLMDAQIWFPYNVVAFGWIPIHVRPLTTACVEAGWQTWISLRAHAFPDDDEDDGNRVATATSPMK